jgi:hypothetical protein
VIGLTPKDSCITVKPSFVNIQLGGAGNDNVIQVLGSKNYLEAKQNIKPNYNSRKVE